MRRRDLVSLLGGAVASWPARAQQSAMPEIGYLGATSLANDARTLVSFRQGLKETGFVEGQNVAIEYRWAEGQYNRLATLAADLIARQVAVLFAPASTPAAQAARAATSTIPVVFTVGSDPVAAGLVASVARPGGNITGVTIRVNLLSAKRLQMLKELLPRANTVAVLMNPKTANAWPDLNETQVAARTLGLQLIVQEASTEHEIDTAFASLLQHRPAAIFFLADGFFRSRYEQVIALAARHKIPASYPWPEFAVFGGLMGYGANQADAWRQGGVYVGRILKGEKPADLPVMQSSKLSFIINLSTGRALGIEVPPTLLALADEVIE